MTCLVNDGKNYQAAKAIGATNSNLRKALNGKCNTARGYI